MTPRAGPNLALRPMLPDDIPLLAEIFRASVEELAVEDYSDGQIEAWTETANDLDAFGKRLSGQLTLIATHDGAPVGFASLKGADVIDMLYVHPAAVGQGAATTLIDALEKLAAARGAKKLTVEASDTAHDFFRRRGYTAKSRNTVLRGDEWLANTTMEKSFGGDAAAAGATLQ
ncbi:MAG: GNAT family N-acetyltransferase [Pseudorhodoplanes sp.]|uniref:GNAT family N-acetyltransferase n=1 Tax=Pseudorhodoplanes sp. TaxID=1934341 RepID=UPI003D11CDF3